MAFVFSIVVYFIDYYCAVGYLINIAYCLFFILQDDHQDVAESAVVGYPHDIKGEGNLYTLEPPHDKSNKMICAPSEDSAQPGHWPSLIRVFAVHSMGS